MILDTNQITTPKFPYYHLTIKDNAVVECIRNPSFGCEGCLFKWVCKVRGGDLIGKT